MQNNKKIKHDIYRSKKEKKKNKKTFLITLGSIMLLASVTTVLSVGVMVAKEGNNGS